MQKNLDMQAEGKMSYHDFPQIIPSMFLHCLYVGHNAFPVPRHFLTELGKPSTQIFLNIDADSMISKTYTHNI